MNVHDSRRIEEVLLADGFEPTEDATLADLVVVNTCSVREKAEHKLMSLLGTLRILKEQRPGVAVAVAGCVAQQEGERLLKKAPVVDLVIGPDNIPELPTLLRELDGGAPPRARTEFDLDDPRFLVAKPRDRSEVTGFVTVMKGCDERCTFCIVPTTRGPERYRSENEIVDEIARMVEGGVREITLLGQTVNSWYDPTEIDAKPRSKTAPSGSRFALLLRRIAAEVPDLARLRYTSPHPRHLTEELMDAHADLAILPRHVHLPVQSGSDRVLRRMARRYTRQEYVERTARLREKVPGLTLSTDLIVGFPGETEEDFEETLSLVREVGFVTAFCFKYSPRPFTPALQLGDDVTEAQKDDRLQRLFEVLGAQQKTHLAALAGARVQVLVEGPNGASETRWTGRSERHELVHLEAPEGIDPTGQLVEVRIEKTLEHSLLGVMEGAAIPATPKPRPKRRKLPLLEALS
ncbi:MAG: tRNA (N6-isopentenyl adenosine(37)-C2)-methylthiotransferase MiaB [Sandaracinus sp.]|nr:tRNA (N6-isopentenyl adenosine(37)-C2)-methylthiotransferase MiaB [Myxococcales bacterium]MCB9600506.1 tRNA (N6-isopentenyl adenosine(37)-C2)-methylthiotransferase MiaB [Sandaracinus sp.]MCB9624831.1 tRNA (N6-isopentenyl adenosine(37)-C2)-methylthiotransferase MiaB [Sandaracinus sp.]MCB9635565.1 tRNA (N6-isopentenyl adenosine(37)-C2)-methylthiotransferase MiaB [Sandaracinus sp.]